MPHIDLNRLWLTTPAPQDRQRLRQRRPPAQPKPPPPPRPERNKDGELRIGGSLSVDRFVFPASRAAKLMFPDQRS